jgi:2,4-dienoyl-CoA reductase-like NADH-dependent reductase (Old Yellow Enzyme family)
MTLEEIDQTVEAFGSAASRAKEAGFDAAQIHGAHGYLVSEFISPLFNKRTDDYGGSVENRARLPVRVVEAVREAVGDDYPLLFRINSTDKLEGGVSPRQMVQTCAMLEEAGVDAFEVSGGTSYVLRTGEMELSWAPTQNRTVYWRDAAEQYKRDVSAPLVLVGGIRSLATAQELADGGVADYISMCRPFVREPDLIGRWEAGDTRDAECLSCNQCGYATLQGQPLHCVQLEASRQRALN